MRRNPCKTGFGRLNPGARVLGVLLVGTSASALEPATLLDTNLQKQEVQVLSYSDGTLRLFGPDRQLATFDESNVVKIEFRHPVSPPVGQQLILNDGQRIFGKMTGVGEDGSLRWSSEKLGDFSIPLDEIHAWGTPHGPPSPTTDTPATPAPVETAENDTVLLSNGDSLAGFVESISPQSLRLQQGDQTLELPWTTVGRVTLSNPIVHRPGVWVVTRAADRLRIENAQLSRGRLSGQVLGRPVPLIEHRTIEFTLRHRLVPLTDLVSTVIAGGNVFGVNRPPAHNPFNPGTLTLHAPLTLRFELPVGTVGLTLRASVDNQDLDWADMLLIVADSQRELARHRLSRAQPEAYVTARPQGARLILQLDESAAGPIRDQLTLDDAAVLVTEETAPR